MARRNPSVAFEGIDVPRGMTSVHFAYIANIICQIYPSTRRLDIARGVAADMKRSNPTFDVARFYVACGVE